MPVKNKSKNMGDRYLEAITEALVPVIATIDSDKRALIKADLEMVLKGVEISERVEYLKKRVAEEL